MENLFKEFLENYIQKLINENFELKAKIEIKNNYINKLLEQIENLKKENK